MQCPFCGQDSDKVVDSRSSEGGRAVRRRRECLACNRRYTTYERPEDVLRISVIKKDGSREPYDRQKIIAGLQKACYKRPITDEQILGVLEAAEEEILKRFDREVPSTFIGDRVSAHLREVDKIAYVRFASVYRNFADVGELINEATEARNTPGPDDKQGSLF
ncbi:MAG TPA: transcriptional regulator NrdR [Phycisphaerales bacterium]|nr:transcriptional regulator NrdR [Phycisphaerales bacterium]